MSSPEERRKSAFLFRKAKEIRLMPEFKRKKLTIQKGKAVLTSAGKKGPLIPRKNLTIQKGRAVLIPAGEKRPLIPRKKLAIQKGKAVLVPITKKKIKDAREKWIKGTKRWTTVRGRITKEKAIGTRPWRGPYPAPLGDDLIIDLKLIHTPESRSDKNAFLNTMLTIYERIRIEILYLIETYTPEDTGALKESLRSSMDRSYSHLPRMGERNPSLKIWLFANVAYAGVVNKMPTYGSPHVRHPPHHPNWRIGRSGHVLDDPTAVGHFYDFILLKARKRAEKIVKEELGILTAAVNMTYNDLIKLFNVKYK